MRSAVRRCAVLAVLWCVPIAAHALPFNQDMAYEPNLPAGTIMRPAPAGAISLGAHERYVGPPEVTAQLQNPVSGAIRSTEKGARLWQVNCAPCHGTFIPQGNSVVHKKSYAVENTLGIYAPNIADKLYHNRTEGQIFSVIHHGLRGMPRYGYKLSVSDHWDLVNYVKKIQSMTALAK